MMQSRAALNPRSMPRRLCKMCPGREIYYNQGIMGFISRITSDLTVRKDVTVVISLLLTTVCGYFATKKQNKIHVFSLFIITLTLIDTLSWQHHFIWLIFPFIATAVTLHRKKMAVPGILLCISYLLTAWNFKHPEIYAHFPAVLFLSNQFYGAILLWGIIIYLLEINPQNT